MHQKSAKGQKVSKHSWEASAKEAACVWHMAGELLALVPIPEPWRQSVSGSLECLLPQARVEAEWLHAYIKGNAGVLVEVQGAILQRNCTDVRDVPTLRALLQEHETKAPVTAPLVEMDSLEDDAFSLLLKKVDYDLQALRVGKVLYSTLIHP